MAPEERETLLSRLAATPAVHTAIRLLRIQQIAAAVLRRVPVRRTLPRTGVQYRVRFLESLLMADELFKREVYGPAFEGLVHGTFIDVGSNVGYFTCYAAERLGRGVVGLAVDGNGAMADETRWHVEHNGLLGVAVVHGIVGFPPDVEEATFYVSASNVGSSAQPVQNPGLPSKGEARAVQAPTVDLDRSWRDHAGDRRVDLLKIDVEGFEQEVLKNLGALLDRTNAVVLEWHKWINDLDEVAALLTERGFSLDRVITEDVHGGVAVFRPAPLP